MGHGERRSLAPGHTAGKTGDPEPGVQPQSPPSNRWQHRPLRAPLKWEWGGKRGVGETGTKQSALGRSQAPRGAPWVGREGLSVEARSALPRLALTCPKGGLEADPTLSKTFNCDPQYHPKSLTVFLPFLCPVPLSLQRIPATSPGSTGAPQPPPPAGAGVTIPGGSAVVFKLGSAGLGGSKAGPLIQWFRFFLFCALKFCKRFCLE